MDLSSDEHVIYSTRFSKRIFMKPFLVSVVALVLAFVLRSMITEYGHYLFWALIAVAVLTPVSPFTKYFLSEFLVTNQRVVIRHGFLSRTSYDMMLKKIESTSVSQSLSDRFIWGSGTLVITGTGGTKEEFPNVGNAVTFEKHLTEALHAA
jgi:uncharacterized membrane protein YdbT with pleckstrin-like domain